MVGRSFSRLSHLSLRLWALTPRFAVLVAGLLASAGMVIAAAPEPTTAQTLVPGNSTRATPVPTLPGTIMRGTPVPTPTITPLTPLTAAYNLDFTQLDCVSESGEWGSDEPYVLFFIGDLTGGESLVGRTSVFGDVDTGETRYETRRLWGHRQMPGNNPDNLIVLAQVMEHDDSNVTHIFDVLRAGLPVKLAQYVAAGHTRNNIANFLVSDMHHIIEDNREIWIGDELFGASRDDMVGWPTWLNITSSDLATAFNGGWTPARTVGAAADGHGVYRIYFRLAR